MPNLLPEGYEEEVIENEDLIENQPRGYKNGLSFDYDTWDFRRDGKNRIIDCDGIESWKAWCINCLHTERYKHLGYSTDFGIDLDLVFSAETRAEAESILEREITEALLADPYERTTYVEIENIDWTQPDTIEVSLIIHGIEDVTIDTTAYLTRAA